MSEFTCNQEIVTLARRNLTQDVWDYLTGGAESEMTMRRNRHALDSYAFIPRVLRDMSQIDVSTTVVGNKVRIPVLLAPIGSLQAISVGGGASAARAAAAFGTIPIISSITEPSLEEIAAATDGPKIFQLYVRGDFDWVKAILGRVKNAGYTSLALTVDSAYYGIRERQLMNRWLPPSVKAQKDRHLQAAITWDLMARIRDFWDGSFILKGIASAEDAEMAVERGVDTLYVSNHGGRQLDHCLGALDTLAEIAPHVKGRAELIVDGGFLRGTDVIKAVALGASAVAIGRLQGWALAAGGEAGLVRCLELIEREIINALGLLGVNDFSQLTASYVRKADVIGPTHELSTFYHLKDRLV
ncbi:alpha-hydroxy acid oxidase [Mesorhizobium sp. P5_C1]